MVWLVLINRRTMGGWGKKLRPPLYIYNTTLIYLEKYSDLSSIKKRYLYVLHKYHTAVLISSFIVFILYFINISIVEL